MKYPMIRWEKQMGTAVQLDSKTITPQSQVLHVTLPFGGFVWQWPTVVSVSENGQTETVPIVDKTRTAVWRIWGMAAVIIALGKFVARRKNE